MTVSTRVAARSRLGRNGLRGLRGATAGKDSAAIRGIASAETTISRGRAVGRDDRPRGTTADYHKVAGHDITINSRVATGPHQGRRRVA